MKHRDGLGVRIGLALGRSAEFAHAWLFERRPVVAYVGGWLGKSNLGDEALHAAAELLFPGICLLRFDGSRVTTALIRRVPLLSSGLLAGGTLIGQKRIWLDLARAYRVVGPELVVFGTGVAHPDFWPGESSLAEWRPLLEESRFVGVRGPLSAELLADAGLSRIEVVGDPVVAFAEEAVSDNPASRSLGLNCGVTAGRRWGTDDRVRNELVRVARWARTAGWKVEWYVVWPEDYEITRSAAVQSGTEEAIICCYLDAWDYLARMRKLGVFVGMKLHATVLATCALTPSIMLEYRPKCRDYMLSIGQGDAIMRTDRFTAEQVWERVQAIDASRNAAATDLAAGIHAIRTRQKALAAQLFAGVERHR